MQTNNRPLSPHLQVYKPQMTSVMSILHRASGVANAVGSLLLIYWLVAAASGPEAFATAQGVLGSFLGQLILFGFTLSVFYHMGNGIRHLVWDTGRALDIDSAYKAGYAVLAAAGVLTVLVWIIGYATGGA